MTTETEGQLLAGEEDDSTSTIEARPIQEVAPDPSQLAKEQSEGYRAVATIHKALQTGQDLLPKQIEAGSQELRKAISETNLHAVDKARSLRDSSGSQ